MTEITRASLKSIFSTGNTADATDFEDLVDSSPNWSDDVGTFFRVLVSAETTADARALLNITAGGTVAAALNDLVDVSVASPNNNAVLQYVSNKWIPYDTGDMGREILAASATSSVHGHLGFGTVGIQILQTEATSSINSIIGLSPTSLGERVIESSATSSARGALGLDVSPTIELTLTATAGETETTSMGFSDPTRVSVRIECLSSSLGCTEGQTIYEFEGFGFSVYTSGQTIGIVMGNGDVDFVNTQGSARTIDSNTFADFKVLAQAYKFS